MRNNINCCLVPLMMTIFLLVVTATQFSFVKSDANLIAKTCKATPLPALCTSTLDYNPSHRSTDDVGTLANIIVDVIVLRSNFVLAIIQGKPPGFAYECSRVFASISKDYVASVRQSLPGGARFALDGIRLISDSATFCLHLQEPSSPIGQLSKQVVNLSAIAKSIIQTLL